MRHNSILETLHPVINIIGPWGASALVLPRDWHYYVFDLIDHVNAKFRSHGGRWFI
jgi:hypothetical protein